MWLVALDVSLLTVNIISAGIKNPVVEGNYFRTPAATFRKKKQDPGS